MIFKKHLLLNYILVISNYGEIKEKVSSSRSEQLKGNLRARGQLYRDIRVINVTSGESGLIRERKEGLT